MSKIVRWGKVIYQLAKMAGKINRLIYGKLRGIILNTKYKFARY